MVGNTEWPKWETGHVRRPGRPARCSAACARNAPLTRPRPGHADLVGMQKYGFDDARPVLERASARETAARVALGAVAARVPRAGRGHRARLARRRARRGRGPGRRRCRRRDDVASARRRPGALLRRRTRAAMVAEIDQCHKDGDTLGGVVEVLAYGAAAGPRQLRALGPPARRAPGRRADGHPGDQGRRGRRRLRARPARRGSQAHDEIVRDADGVTRAPPAAPAASRAA